MSDYIVVQPLRCILLIDDDHATNFMHRLIIERLGIVQEIKIALNGRDAIELLTDHPETPPLLPDLIFLDINMPIMDGWQFLKAYRQHYGDSGSTPIICMLSTALPDRIMKENESVAALVERFIEKPLTRQMLLELATTYYPGHIQMKDGPGT